MATETTKIPFVEGAAPATPAANRVTVYAKADGLIYSKDDAGVETLVSGGTGSGGAGTITTYTPTLTGSTTNPTVGNGTLVGLYAYLASKLVWVSMSWTFGSTSNAGSGAYTVALPFAAAGGRNQVLSGYVLDSGTAYFACAGQISASGSVFTPIAADATGSRQVSNGQPMTWANGDSMGFEGVYEIA